MPAEQGKRAKGRPGAEMEVAPEIVTLRGVVIPVQWDDEGNATAVALSAYDEDEYFIDRGGEGVRLMADMRKRVEVQGMVREEAGRKIITVKAYSLGSTD